MQTASSPAAAGDFGAADSLGVVVLAPTGRDGPLMCEALQSVGFRAVAVRSAAELVDLVSEEVQREGQPRVGALVTTDDALGVEWAVRLAQALDRQPTWSDIPLILLCSSAGTAAERRWSGPSSPTVVGESLTGRGMVTVLDRPVRVATLVSAVRAALRARSRQAEVRDLIESRDLALADAERANRVKSEFLAMMSHELRTPLNAIAGYVDLLLMGLRGPINEAQQEDLERIQRSERHLLGIINDILNLARIESGRIEYTPSLVPLQDAVTEVLLMVQPQLAAKGLTLQDLDGASDVAVWADREKLQQVVLNLLSNAVKFTPHGGMITLSAAHQDPDQVVFRVSDTGVGIPEDRLESIFEPFVQVRSDNGGAPREGTGLGLAISRDLARGMGGDIMAISRPGEGSTFVLTLPVAAEMESAAPQRSEVARQSA